VRRTTGAILLALGAAGCTVGPDYKVPSDATANSPGANGAFVNGGDAAFEQAALPDHWWRLYDDSRLDGYVREALAANTDLRAADANLRRATFVIREAQAAQTPSTTITGSFAHTRQGGIDILSFPGDSYSLGGAVFYPLDLAGGIRRAVEATRANAEAVRATRDEVRVTVAAAVARNYVAVCSANRSLAAAEHVVSVERETLDEVQRLAATRPLTSRARKPPSTKAPPPFRRSSPSGRRPSMPLPR
jgi:outer membrane protein TolC